MSAPIPKGVEVLVHKAAVDAEFKAALLERRAAAAEDIGLTLDAAETAMLAAVPAAQLETIIARTSVPEAHRRAFLGKAAAAMAAALAAMSGGVAAGFQLQGVRPDNPPAPTGVRPDKPVPPPTRGIQPDRPPPKPPTTADRVMAIVRTQLKVPDGQAVVRDTKLVKDLKADAARRRRALQGDRPAVRRRDSGRGVQEDRDGRAVDRRGREGAQRQGEQTAGEETAPAGPLSRHRRRAARTAGHVRRAAEQRLAFVDYALA